MKNGSILLFLFVHNFLHLLTEETHMLHNQTMNITSFYELP